jgi:hypothetical protein
MSADALARALRTPSGPVVDILNGKRAQRQARNFARNGA